MLIGIVGVLIGLVLLDQFLVSRAEGAMRARVQRAAEEQRKLGLSPVRPRTPWRYC